MSLHDMMGAFTRYPILGTLQSIFPMWPPLKMDISVSESPYQSNASFEVENIVKMTGGSRQKFSLTFSPSRRK